MVPPLIFDNLKKMLICVLGLKQSAFIYDFYVCEKRRQFLFLTLLLGSENVRKKMARERRMSPMIDIPKLSHR